MPSIVRALGPGLAAVLIAGATAAQAPTPAAIARARADSMRLPYTVADIHFMSGMIQHHAQAIVMAGWATSHDAGQSVQTLCERIVNAQQDEIRLMQQWLAERNQPVPKGTPAEMAAGMTMGDQEMLMPGMLTDKQMKALDAARGQEFDRLFLTGMIQHHRGAIAMVKALFDTPGAGQDETAFKLASDVNVDQTTEITRMQRMLAATLGIELP